MTARTHSQPFTDDLGIRPEAMRALHKAEHLPGFRVDHDTPHAVRITGAVLDHHRRQAAQLRREAFTALLTRLVTRTARLAEPHSGFNRPANGCC